MSTGTIWRMAIPTQQTAEVVDLRIRHPAGEVITQVSSIEGNPSYPQDGFLIRAWPANGTHENGGSDLTEFTAILTIDDDGHLLVKKIEFYGADGR